MNCESSLITQWDREVSSKIHKKKLEDIKHRDIKQLNKSSFASQPPRKYHIDRSIEISRDNRILYEKLIQIAERKTAVKTQSPIPITPKALNLKYKKLEADRIVKENMHLVNLLSVNNSELSFKKMIKDYELISEYKDRISKKKFQERIKKAVKFNGKTLNKSQMETGQNKLGKSVKIDEKPSASAPINPEIEGKSELNL